MDIQSLYDDEAHIPAVSLRDLYVKDEETGKMHLRGFYTDHDLKGLKNTVIATRKERDQAQDHLKTALDQHAQHQTDLENRLQSLTQQLADQDVALSVYHQQARTRTVESAVQTAVQGLGLPAAVQAGFMAWAQRELTVNGTGDVSSPDGLSVHDWITARYEAVVSVIGVSWGGGSSGTQGRRGASGPIRLTQAEAMETTRYMQAQQEAHKRGVSVIVGD